MKNIIISNLIYFAGFILIGILYFFIPHFICIGIGIIWLIWALSSNYLCIVMDSDIRYRLKQADSRKFFRTQVEKIIWALDSFREGNRTFCQYEEDNSIRKTFEILNRRVWSNAEKACRFMKNYNYTSGQNMGYLTELVKDCETAVQKLSELSDLVTQVEDSASEVDISYVDDMLAALKQVKDL